MGRIGFFGMNGGDSSRIVEKTDHEIIAYRLYVNQVFQRNANYNNALNINRLCRSRCLWERVVTLVLKREVYTKHNKPL